MVKKYDGSPAEFLERATTEPARLGALAVNSLKAIVAGQGPFPPRARFTVDVTDPVDTCRGGCLDLIFTSSAPELVADIVAADADGKLRAERREVLVRSDFLQTRIVLFVGNRVVGQLFAGTDKQSLQLDIAEPSEAWDIGNGLLSFVNPDCLPFKVHAI